MLRLLYLNYVFLGTGCYILNRTNALDTNWRWEKHKKGGWIVLAISSFSPTEFIGQKTLEYNFWSDVQILNTADKTKREIEKRDTKQLYRFLP